MIPTHNGLIVKGVLTFPWTVVGRGFRYVIATIFGYIHAQDGEGSLCPALVSLLNKLAPFAHHTCLGAGSLCLVSVAKVRRHLRESQRTRRESQAWGSSEGALTSLLGGSLDPGDMPSTCVNNQGEVQR